MTTALRLAAVAVTALALASCSMGSHAQHEAASPSGTTGASGADVMFAQMMIPHHEQAVEMSTLAETRASDSRVKALASRIRSEQQPEIDQMTAWLEEWGMPVMDADDAMGAHMDHGMSGMLSEQQMAELEAASGTQFDVLFLEGMIEHHEGAIDMAEDVTDSADPRVSALAKAIVTAQQEEIDQMQQLLAELKD